MNHPEVIIVPAFFSSIAYIVWVLVTASQRKQRVKLMTEFHSRLIDRLGSVRDLGDFLQTEAGTRFMKDLASEPVTGPRDRILRAAQLSAVLTCLGLGVMLLAFFSPTLSNESLQGLSAFGVIALSLGVGFACSAAASYRLSGVLGLLSHERNEASVPGMR